MVAGLRWSVHFCELRPRHLLDGSYQRFLLARVGSSYEPRLVQSTCNPHVERLIREGSGFGFQELSVWLLVPKDGGTTAGSEFLGPLQCPSRKFLLELGGASSRLAT